MADNIPSSLTGKRIVITRAVAESDQLARELSTRGAIPLEFPLISFEQPEDFGLLDEAIAGIAQFDWLILTSVRAVRAVVWRALELQKSLLPGGSRLRVACVGPVTASAARDENLPVEHVATTHNGAALVEELGSKLAGAKVFLPRSDRANPDLPAALKRHGAEVTEVVAYRTVAAAEVDGIFSTEIVNGATQALLFFSPSAVKCSAKFIGHEKLCELQDKMAITAVGPVTAKALREAGVERMVVAADTTAAAVLEALEKHFAAAKVAPAGVKQG